MRLGIVPVLALSAGIAAAAPPARVTLHYDVSQNGAAMVEVTEKLEHDARGYRIDSEWRGKGLFALLARGKARRSSQGSIEARGLRPGVFRDQRGDGPEGVARFDWGRMLLTRERDGRVETDPLPEGAQDRLSFVYAMAFFPPGSGEISAPVADARGMSRHRYAVAGRETLNTPAGQFEALKLVKQRDPGDGRETEIWLATKRDFLPLRIVVVEKDGTRRDQILTRIEP